MGAAAEAVRAAEIEPAGRCGAATEFSLAAAGEGIVRANERSGSGARTGRNPLRLGDSAGAARESDGKSGEGASSGDAAVAGRFAAGVRTGAASVAAQAS